MQLAQVIDIEIKKIAPISGVSVGKVNDKSTWKVHFDVSANEQQKAAVSAFISGFSWDEGKKESAENESKEKNALSDLALKKLFILEREKNPDIKLSEFLRGIETAVIDSK